MVFPDINPPIHYLPFTIHAIYQLAFLTPGIFPCNAMSRNIPLDTPKYRIYPRGRPVSWQRFFKRTVEEFLGRRSSAL